MKNHHLDLIEQHGAQPIITALEPFVTERRKRRINEVLSYRLDSIQIAIESPSDINNALATIRSSEALGISTVHIITPKHDASAIQTITQGAFYWIELRFYQTFNDFLAQIKKEDRLLIGAVIDSTTQPLSKVSIEHSLCLIIGNEQTGLSQTAKNACTHFYHIPMVGMSESLNLSVSAAISLYDLSQRKRQTLNHPGDLLLKQNQKLKARYYMNSINPRLIQTLWN